MTDAPAPPLPAAWSRTPPDEPGYYWFCKSPVVVAVNVWRMPDAPWRNSSALSWIAPGMLVAEWNGLTPIAAMIGRWWPVALTPPPVPEGDAP